MKNLLIVTSLILICMGCKKSDVAPAQNQTVTSISYSHADSLISGNWILDKDELYNQGVLQSTTNHTDPVNCHMNLQLMLYQAPDTNWKSGIFGLSCNNATGPWKLNNGIDINSTVYNILLQSNTNLVIQWAISPGLTQKYYLHK